MVHVILLAFASQKKKTCTAQIDIQFIICHITIKIILGTDRYTNTKLSLKKSFRNLCYFIYIYIDTKTSFEQVQFARLPSYYYDIEKYNIGTIHFYFATLRKLYTCYVPTT